jgi:hypothetical protein
MPQSHVVGVVNFCGPHFPSNQGRGDQVNLRQHGHADCALENEQAINAEGLRIWTLSKSPGTVCPSPIKLVIDR